MKLSFKKQLGVVLLYLVLAIVMTYPVVTHLTTHVAGVGGDPWQTMWRFEQKWALLQEVISSAGDGQVLSSLIRDEFLGGGEPRLVNLSVWPWLWLQMIFTQPLVYNIVWLASFVLSGYGMYLLVRYLLKNYGQRSTIYKLSEQAAIVAGLLYMFLPYHVAQAQGHFGAMQTQWLPLSVLALLVFIKRQTWLTTLALAAVMTMQAWSEHHYALWLLLFTLLLIYFERSAVMKLWRSVKGRGHTVLLAGLLLVFVMLPYAPTIKLALVGDSLQPGVDQTVRFSADLFAYIVPAPWHPVWGGLTNLVFSQNFTGNVAEATHFIGLVPMLLIIFFHQRLPKQQKKLWVWVAIIFALLSLGPRLHLFGRVTALPLPYALIDQWPVFSAVRAVARAGVMVGLSVAVLLGWVVATNVKRVKMTWLLAGLLILEFMFLPVPIQSVELSPAYARVADWAGRTIIELPAATNYTAASRSLYASGRHGKEVVGSIALERNLDSSVLTEVRSLPALRQLLYLRTTHLRERRADFFAQELPETLPDVLDWLEVGGLVIHTDSLSALQLKTVRAWLEEDLKLVPETIDDIVLYEVNQADLPAHDGVFMTRDGRWENVGFDEERGSVFAEIPTTAGTVLYNNTPDPLLVELSFGFAPESHGELVIESNRGIEAALNKVGGDQVVLKLILQPGQTPLTYINQREEKVIIRDPQLIVK